MAGSFDFNPHETPPQKLKDVFKSWKGQLTPERDQNLNESVINMPRADSISHDRLVEIFNRFSSDDDANDLSIAEQVALDSPGSIYNSQNVPGMKHVHIADSSRTNRLSGSLLGF
jgi:alkylated DNA repair protein alkB family protein 1